MKTKSTKSTEKYDNGGHEKVQCRVCKPTEVYYHRLESHIYNIHGLTADQYLESFPGAPLMSERAQKISNRQQEIAEAVFEAQTEPLKVEAPEKGIYKIGCARLKMRTDLDENEQRMVPAFDPNWSIGEKEKENLEYLAMGLQAKDPVFIVGPTGSGKSTMVSQLAAACNQPMRRMNLHGDVRAADFIGDKTVSIDPESGQSIISFQYGILPKAMKEGSWLLLDELDAGQAHILFVLQAVLENGMTLVLSGNYGEVIKAHKNFRFIATANTLGRGDDSGMYAGTNMMNEAFLDRFGVVIKADYVDEATEAKILVQKTNLNESDAKGMVFVANQVRKLLEKEEVYCTFGTRRLIHWADKAVRLGNVVRAARVTVLNRLSEEDSKKVSGLIQRKFGGA